ncbi:860_t:CDS:1, partial [Ambispora leptoticha]
IVKKQEKYAKERERSQRSFDKALKYLNIKHGNSQTKLGDRIRTAKTKFGEKADHPLICTHDHCLWWRKEHVFKDFKSSIKNSEKEEEDDD